MLAYFRGASIILFGSVYYRQLPYDLLGLFASRIFPLLLLAGVRRYASACRRVD